MKRIIIEVIGGIVTRAYSDDPNVKIEVLDRDNFCDPDCDGDEYNYYSDLEKEINSNTLKIVY